MSRELKLRSERRPGHDRRLDQPARRDAIHRSLLSGLLSQIGVRQHDEASNRGVSVDARAIIHALDKVYGATGLVAELTGK